MDKFLIVVIIFKLYILVSHNFPLEGCTLGEK